MRTLQICHQRDYPTELTYEYMSKAHMIKVKQKTYSLTGVVTSLPLPLAIRRVISDRTSASILKQYQ